MSASNENGDGLKETLGGTKFFKFVRDQQSIKMHIRTKCWEKWMPFQCQLVSHQ